MTLSYVAFTESESTIDSKEVGRVGEESNAMDSISVEFDTRLLREWRQMEIDFENQSDVYCKRPMQCPVKGMLEASQREYRSRLCERELKRSGSDIECATLSPLARKIRSFGCFRSMSYEWHREWCGE